MPCHAMPCHAMPCHAMPCLGRIKRAAVHCRLSQDRTGAGVVVERQERECRALAASLAGRGPGVRRQRRERPPETATSRLPGPPGCPRFRRDHRGARLAHRPAAPVTQGAGDLHRRVRAARGRSPARSARASCDLATASGRMVTRQLGAVARYESGQTAGRTRAGKADAASRGAWSGGQRIYGYELVPLSERRPGGSALRVVPVEVEVVQDAARRVL